MRKILLPAAFLIIAGLASCEKSETLAPEKQSVQPGDNLMCRNCGLGGWDKEGGSEGGARIASPDGVQDTTKVKGKKK